MELPRLPYLKTYRDRHGRVRCYVRRRDAKDVAVVGEPGTVEFQASYDAAIASEPMPTNGDRPKFDVPVGPIVYFARQGRFVKIGMTRKGVNRLDNLQIGSPLPLEIVLVLSGDIKLEREMHRRFGKSRTRGEWFRLSPDLLAFIAHERLKQRQVSNFPVENCRSVSNAPATISV